MEHSPELASSELANLWSSYMSDSLSSCIMTYFLRNVEDLEIKEILQHSKDLSDGHLKTIRAIFEGEGIPVPHGYTEADVNKEATRLFSDIYYLRFLQLMGRTGSNVSSMYLGTAFRDDVRAYYLSAVKESIILYDRIINLMKEKGVLMRTPYIAYPERVEFVKDESFLAGYLTMKRRPLLAVEVTNLATTIEANYIGRIFIEGLGNMTNNSEVKRHFEEGYSLATKIIKTLQQSLEKEHLHSSFGADSIVLDAGEAPFSDKLLMGINTGLITISMTNMGKGISTSMRSDLVGEYTELLARVGKYEIAGAKLAIKNGWMEKPPQTLERRN